MACAGAALIVVDAEVIAAARDCVYLDGSPIIALTAHVIGVDATAWRDAGMDDQRSESAKGAFEALLVDEETIAELGQMAGEFGESFVSRIIALYQNEVPKVLAH